MTRHVPQERVAHGAHPLRAGWDGWTVGALVIALIVAVPLVAVIGIAFFPRENIWPHLISTTLPRYLGNSLGLMALVGTISAAIGTGAAWLVVMTDFPFRRLLEGLLFAPLAVPAYIAAYALVDLLEYAGPVQTGLRGLFGWHSARDYWFPEIRSFWSAGIVLGFALYPYVYLLARAAFREQSAGALDVARTLGCGPWRSFLRVSLPLARPAIVIGTAVAMMETLNDFGAVDYFAVQTLTTGIFSVWLEGGNAGGAAQIACVSLAVILGLLMIERAGRARRRFHNTARQFRPPMREALRPLTGWLACALCLIPILIGFVLPVSVMLSHVLGRADLFAGAALWRAGLHTLVLSGATAVLALAAGLVLAYGARLSRHRLLRALTPLTQLGYAAPGAVVALGVLIPFAALDNAAADAVLALTGWDPGLVITGSAAAVVLAYLVRFFAVAQGAMDSALGRVSPSMDMAARSLGRTPRRVLSEIHLPLMRSSILTAGLVIFVDAAKELPATLILRPFNFDTLATLTYNQASLERLDLAAPPALVVVVLGILPLVLMGRRHGTLAQM
ncbi:MAG: iron ABC transporter permease [Alphaproteobacteria bacterium]|nr:MAG: iron ABC transporter permease [Alphaproteobacteria bacterium]